MLEEAGRGNDLDQKLTARWSTLLTDEEEDAMQDHPQITAFREAARILGADRYWHHDSPEERVELLRALRDVLTEVCFQLDAHRVLPRAVLQICQDLAAPGIRDVPAAPSAGFLLVSYLDARIEQLIADSNDSGNTGAEGSRGY
jgi:hypothetical protein